MKKNQIIKTRKTRKKQIFVGKESKDSDAESEFYMDEKAEIRVIAKKMLRKKDRIDILNKTYNCYVYYDSELVPDCFMELEKNTIHQIYL